MPLPAQTDDYSQGERIRANIRCSVNASQIRREKRDGRDVLVVPSYTLPDDVVMNGILYPAAEIENSYTTLEGTPAPLGHPTVNGMFVPSRSPLGLNIGYFGAWNANVTRKDGRVYVEKIIDVERASESAMGRRVLAALESNQPIHTSTGLLMNIRECSRSDLANWEGYDMEFDHDAILLDEQGAATPAQGVGMLVNQQKIRVVNSSLDEEIDELGTELITALERQEAASKWEQIKGAIMEAIGLSREQIMEADMAETGKDDKFDALSARMDKLEDAVKNMGKVTEKNSADLDAINRDRHAAQVALVEQVVNAKLLPEDVAKGTPPAALKALLANHKGTPVPAPGIQGNMQSQAEVFDFNPLGTSEKKEA